jgi:YrbI family 3-deoxy-D-manno-octulosonate 8-phosphate phosphatase
MDRMVDNSRPEVLAVVQARGGSKSLPRKNLRTLAGYPLIAYSIAAGLAAKGVTRLIVSTDDPEIAAVSRDYGAEVPFLRPAELAQDDTPDLPLFQHALRWLEDNEGYRPDIVVQLRPTSPLRPAALIDTAIEKLSTCSEADCVRGVTIASQNPYKMWRVNDANGLLYPLLAGEFHEPYNMPRQHLPKAYWQTGHIDAIRYETIVVKKSLTGERVLPLMIDRIYCIDIDTELDWRYAEWLLTTEAVLTVKPQGRATGANAPRAVPLPPRIDLVVLDFDGVLTDNRVWVTEDGVEAVACNRSDGMGLAMLCAAGIEVVVLSTEVNPVVAARCRKLGLAYLQGVQDKEASLRTLAAERKVDLTQAIYVGNDLNDLGCMRMVGCSVAVADAHPAVVQAADWVLHKAGGRGAVRELCELITAAIGNRSRSHEQSS